MAEPANARTLLVSDLHVSKNLAATPHPPSSSAAPESRPPSLLSAHTPPPRHLLCLLGGAAPVGGSRGGDTHHASTSGAGVRGVGRIFLAGEQQPGRSLSKFLSKASNFGFFLRARVCADELLRLTLRLPGPRPCRSGSRLCVRQQRQVERPLQLSSVYPDATEDLNCAQCRWAGSPGPDSKRTKRPIAKHADSNVAPNLGTEEPNRVLETYAEAQIGVREQATCGSSCVTYFPMFTPMIAVIAVFMSTGAGASD
nr:uncharacterized protein LOC127304316 [Lolium perenne]